MKWGAVCFELAWGIQDASLRWKWHLKCILSEQTCCCRHINCTLDLSVEKCWYVLLKSLICEPLGAPLFFLRRHTHIDSVLLKCKACGLPPGMIYCRCLRVVRFAPVWPSQSKNQPLSPGIANRQWHTLEGCHLFRGGCDAPLAFPLLQGMCCVTGGTLLVPEWKAPSSQNLPFKQGFWHLSTDDWLHLIVKGNFRISFVVLSFINFLAQTDRTPRVWSISEKSSELLLYTMPSFSMHKQADLKTLLEVTSPSRACIRFYLHL